MNDVSPEVLEPDFKGIAWSVGKLVDKGKLSEGKEIVLSRVKTTFDLSSGPDVDMAIEAVFENLDR